MLVLKVWSNDRRRETSLTPASSFPTFVSSVQLSCDDVALFGFFSVRALLLPFDDGFELLALLCFDFSGQWLQFRLVALQFWPHTRIMQTGA